MRYLCLACDYDGTIATDGRVSRSTVAALQKVAASGRKLVLVTGRELDDLKCVFPELNVFDRVVAENGALLYSPRSHGERRLTESPPQKFTDELSRRGIPFSVGRAIVASWHPHENEILEVIREMGLDLHLTFNKGSVMVLPSSVNKATGLRIALDELCLSPHNAIGVGDAENDFALLALCECGAAVANALPELKSRADLVMTRDHGAGVEELIEGLLADELASVVGRLKRRQLPIGRTRNGDEYFLDPHDTRVLIAGASGSGKSTVVAAVVEKLIAQEYQVCLIDPEGDYDNFEKLVTLGGPNNVPEHKEIVEVLTRNLNSLNINLLGVRVEDRPKYFLSILPRVQELRAHTGRPHWLIIDEAHHLLPETLDSAALIVPRELGSLCATTVHPGRVHPAILESMNSLIVVGPRSEEVLKEFSTAKLDFPAQPNSDGGGNHSEVLAWNFAGPGRANPEFMTIQHGTVERRRHRRKYAAGELGDDRAFYFRGAEGKLRLKAQNLGVFTQTAQGIDDETWNYHLKRGDYSAWLRDAVKDPDVGAQVEVVEKDGALSPVESRKRIADIINRHYTAPE